MQWWLNSTRSSCLKNTCSVISPASVNTAHSTILGDKYVLERATRHHRCTVSRVGYISRCEGSNLSVSATNLCYPPEEMINKILQLILQKVGLATDVMYRTKISFLGVLLSVLLQHLYTRVSTTLLGCCMFTTQVSTQLWLCQLQRRMSVQH